MTWTHDQLEGWIGRWFVDRGWYPCMTELDVGYVEGGGNLPRWAQDDEDYQEIVLRWAKPAQRKRIEKHLHDRSWVADVAGMMIFSRSRLHNMRLDHLHDLDIPGEKLTWLCEVKVQRSDFLKDDKFDKPPQAHLQFVACPKGLIEAHEIPKGWGLLEVADSGDGHRVFKNNDRLLVHDIDRETEVRLVERMVWAMWWRHSNETMQTFHRKATSEAQIRRDANKVSSIVYAICDYIRGSEFLERRGRNTLKDCLRGHGIRRRVSGGATSQVDKLKEEFHAQRH